MSAQVASRRRATEVLVSAPVLSWVTARLAVLAALAFTRFLVDHTGARAASGGQPVGLLGWDAAWYQRILDVGYTGLPEEALRFFPLLPLLAAPVTLFAGTGPALLAVANGASLAAGFAVHRLVVDETSDRRLADRTVWVFALFPAAFVLVMGYAEGLLVLTAALCFRFLRRSQWRWAALAGLAAGLARPLGLLLVVPAAVEVLAARRRGSVRLGSAAAAVIGPIVGSGLYLGWVGLRFGDPLEPLAQQQESLRRGPFVDPVSRLIDAGAQLLRGEEIGSGLHLPWALLFLGLLVVVARRLPLSYTLFSAAVLLVAVSSTNLDSLERYALSAFPLCIGAAVATRAPWAERAALGLSTAGLVIYASLAFLGVYVP